MWGSRGQSHNTRRTSLLANLPPGARSVFSVGDVPPTLGSQSPCLHARALTKEVTETRREQVGGPKPQNFVSLNLSLIPKPGQTLQDRVAVRGRASPASVIPHLPGSRFSSPRDERSRRGSLRLGCCQACEAPTHLVPILHDVAGVGVGFHQLVLLVEGLFGQILLQKCKRFKPSDHRS